MVFSLEPNDLDKTAAGDLGKGAVKRRLQENCTDESLHTTALGPDFSQTTPNY